MPAPHRDPVCPCRWVEWPLAGSPAASILAGSHSNADFDLSCNASYSLAAAALLPDPVFCGPPLHPGLGTEAGSTGVSQHCRKVGILTQTPPPSFPPCCFAIVGSPAGAVRLQGAPPACAPGWHTWASHTALGTARHVPGYALRQGSHPAPGYPALLTQRDGHGAGRGQSTRVGWCPMNPWVPIPPYLLVDAVGNGLGPLRQLGRAHRTDAKSHLQGTGMSLGWRGRGQGHGDTDLHASHRGGIGQPRLQRCSDDAAPRTPPMWGTAIRGSFSWDESKHRWDRP